MIDCTECEHKNYVIWSNEHAAWWAQNKQGYRSNLSHAGRYGREEALRICTGARGGRRYNDNPSEVPILAEDAEVFWPDGVERYFSTEAWEEQDND